MVREMLFVKAPHDVARDFTWNLATWLLEAHNLGCACFVGKSRGF